MGGVEPEIIYYDTGWKNASVDAYSEYHIKKAQSFIESPRNIIVVPEVSTNALYYYKNIQKVIWWLSVDFYLSHMIGNLNNFIESKKYLSYKFPLFYNFTDKENIFHLVQSRYALDFLRANEVPNEKIAYLSDYLEPVFLQKTKNVDITKKEKIVVYNPQKGLEFTKKIIAFAPNIKFIPIENMTPEEVKNLLARAMVYIDFGNHPGKDRIPREAAISGCVVITGKRGAAANDEDIPIDAEFKFDDDESEIANIVKKIEEVFENFSVYHAKFEKYREIILNEPQKFEQDLIKALNLNAKKKFASVAFFQSGARGRFLKQITENDKNLKAVFRCGEEGDEGVEDIEKISFDDAVFLYFEGRIEKFMAVFINEAEKEIIEQKLTLAGVSANDVIFVEVKR